MRTTRLPAARSRSLHPIWRSPFSLLDLPRLLSLGGDWDEDEEGSPTASYPVDVHERDDAIHVEAELPGFKKDEIEVSVDSGLLTIRAERTVPPSEGTRHVSERRFTRVQRSFTLPSSVDESKVEASLSDGVLEIKLPKRAETKSHKIKVR